MVFVIDETFKSDNIILLIEMLVALKKAVGWGSTGTSGSSSATRLFSAAQSQLFQHQGLPLSTHLRLRPQPCTSSCVTV